MGTPLPPGWRSAIDPKHNREYYFDPSGNVQWTVPSAALAPAAAAAVPVAAAETSTPAAAATSAATAAAPSPAAAAPAAGGEESLFKKPKRNKNVRARPSASDADESGSAVVRKVGKVNPMVQSTSTGARDRDALGMEFAQPSDVRISTYDNKVFATNEQDTEKHLDAQTQYEDCLLYTSPSPRDTRSSRMPSSA